MRRFDEKRKEWRRECTHTHKHTLPANRWPLICDLQLINSALEKVYYFDVFLCVCVFGAPIHATSSTTELTDSGMRKAGDCAPYRDIKCTVKKEGQTISILATFASDIFCRLLRPMDEPADTSAIRSTSTWHFFYMEHYACDKSHLNFSVCSLFPFLRMVRNTGTDTRFLGQKSLQIWMKLGSDECGNNNLLQIMHQEIKISFSSHFKKKLKITRWNFPLWPSHLDNLVIGNWVFPWRRMFLVPTCWQHQYS